MSVYPKIARCQCDGCRQSRALEAVERAVKIADAFYEYEVLRHRIASNVIPFPAWRTKYRGQL